MSSDDKVKEPEKKVEELVNQVGLLEDEKAIRKLHYSYGYYLDKCLYNEVVDLFAENTYTPRQWWEGGLYENDYVKEDGIRKIKVLNYRPVYHATFEHGWTYTKPQFVPFFNRE